MIRHFYNFFFFLAKVFDYGLSSARRLVDAFFFYWWRWWSFTYIADHFLRWPKNCLDRISLQRAEGFLRFSPFLSADSVGCFLANKSSSRTPGPVTSDYENSKKSNHFGELVNKKVEVLVKQNHSLSSNPKKT